ncbi:MAG TPA: NYN domain-containing protein [Thermodesulfobacteriota bacterium]|nr:NYN domain-containing protein [Thermodesulfobacteriota bacterium]
MAVQIIIDGYNLIRQYPSLARAESRDFSQGREKLLHWLAEYRRAKPLSMTVVFDGGQGGGFSEEHDLYKGIRITYSPMGQTADDIIKRLVRNKPAQSLVVSSDLELVNYCRSLGAGTMGSLEFASRVDAKLEGSEDLAVKDKEEEEEAPTPKKKKGASHRISKRKKRETRFWKEI